MQPLTDITKSAIRFKAHCQNSFSRSEHFLEFRKVPLSYFMPCVDNECCCNILLGPIQSIKMTTNPTKSEESLMDIDFCRFTLVNLN